MFASLLTTEFAQVFKSTNIESTQMPKNANRVIHTMPSDDLRSACNRFATNFVAQEISNRFRRQCAEELKSFIYGARNAPLAQGLAGDLFEPIAFSQLSRGGQFLRRNLKTDVQDTVEFKFDVDLPALSSSGPPLAKKRKINPTVPGTSIPLNSDCDSSDVQFLSHMFHYVEEIKDMPDSFFLYPAWRTLAGVDALAKKQNLFQLTVGAHHPVKFKGLCEALAAMQIDHGDLYFVVPTSALGSFQLQPYEFEHECKGWCEKKKRTRQCLGCAKADPNISQFVIGVDITPV